MYMIKSDGIVIYNDKYTTEGAKAINPKLTLRDNSAGTLEITLPPGNAGYEKLKRLVSEIIVYRDNKEIWSGRIISAQKDFWNNQILTCEGELAYLNDTSQPPKVYEDVTIESFLESLIEVHNSNVEDKKKFNVGVVVGFNKDPAITDTYTFTTDDEITLDVINDQLIGNFDGHLILRKDPETGIRYLDYRKEWPDDTNTQEIRFGLNLLDFTQNWDMTDFCTVVVPKGAKLDEVDASEVGGYLDVTEAVDENGNKHGSRYVTNEDGIKEFGWIEKVISWDDVTDPDELLQNGLDYLKDHQFDALTIEATALDLRYLGLTADSIKVLDKVRCISSPHGVDKLLNVSELTLQFDNPENSTYTLSSETKENSFTGSIVTRTDSKKQELSILQDAFYDATQKINSATRGVVTITRTTEGSESIAILNSKTWISTYEPDTGYWSSDAKLWKWSIGGLGFSTDGGRSFTNIAMTSDGAIVANSITVGELSTITIRSINDNSYWNLSDGTFAMKEGYILLGEKSGYGRDDYHFSTGSDGKTVIKDSDGNVVEPNLDHYNFAVDDAGNLHAELGYIGGFTINSSELYNDALRLDAVKGLTIREGGEDFGFFGPRTWEGYSTQKGITMTLEYSSTPRYIVWENKDRASDSIYTVKLGYASKQVGPSSNGLTADRISLGCPIDGWDCVNERFWIDPNTGGANGGWDSGRTEVLIPSQIDSNSGIVTEWYKAYVRNGFLVPA